jgi:hypothetical protein
MSTTERWLPPSAAADRLGVYPHELAKLVRDGKIPALSRRLGLTRPRYDLEALDLAMADEKTEARHPMTQRSPPWPLHLPSRP